MYGLAIQEISKCILESYFAACLYLDADDAKKKFVWPVTCLSYNSYTHLFYDNQKHRRLMRLLICFNFMSKPAHQILLGGMHFSMALARDFVLFRSHNQKFGSYDCSETRDVRSDRDRANAVRVESVTIQIVLSRQSNTIPN